MLLSVVSESMYTYHLLQQAFPFVAPLLPFLPARTLRLSSLLFRLHPGRSRSREKLLISILNLDWNLVHVVDESAEINLFE